MSKGYIVIALNSGDEDYIKCAYCLALSLKLTQKMVNSLSIVTDYPEKVSVKYRDVFDNVILLPHPDLSINSSWRVENYYQLYDASPYDETVTLDADMLFFDDVSNWWEAMAEKDVVITDTIIDYRGAVIKYNPLREYTYKYNLPDLHNGFLYFKKCSGAERLFKAIYDYASDWKEACERMIGDIIHYSSDGALQLALKELGLLKEYTFQGKQFPKFVHMKTCMQGWEGAIDKDWRKYIDFNFDREMNLFIGGYRIYLPFHYHVRNFVTDDLIALYEKVLGI